MPHRGALRRSARRLRRVQPSPWRSVYRCGCMRSRAGAQSWAVTCAVPERVTALARRLWALAAAHGAGW